MSARTRLDAALARLRACGERGGAPAVEAIERLADAVVALVGEAVEAPARTEAIEVSETDRAAARALARRLGMHVTTPKR